MPEAETGGHPVSGRPSQTPSETVSSDLQVMLRESSPFSPVQVGQLASFLSRLMTRSSSILVTADLFTEVLDRLTEGSGLREERQTALLDILSPDDSAWKHFHLEHLETRSRSAGFYRVLERLFVTCNITLAQRGVVREKDCVSVPLHVAP